MMDRYSYEDCERASSLITTYMNSGMQLTEDDEGTLAELLEWIDAQHVVEDCVHCGRNVVENEPGEWHHIWPGLQLGDWSCRAHRLDLNGHGLISDDPSNLNWQRPEWTYAERCAADASLESWMKATPTTGEPQCPAT